jgi:hypothetical protein
MRIKTIKNVVLLLLYTIMPHKSKAQDRNLSLIQDVKFEKLLTEKKN